MNESLKFVFGDFIFEIKIGEISLGILREVSPPNSHMLKKELLEFKFVLVSNAPLNLKLKL